jgi:hypothetical protein
LLRAVPCCVPGGVRAVSEAVGHVNGASFVLLATVVLRNSVV